MFKGSYFLPLQGVYNMNNTSTLLNFFRINRLLTYVVLAMVLPSIAWPAGLGDDGRDYAAQRPSVFAGGTGLRPAHHTLKGVLSSQDTRISFASTNSRTQGSRFDVLNPLGRNHAPAMVGSPLTVTRYTTSPLDASRAVVASALPLGDSSISNAGLTQVDMPETPLNLGQKPKASGVSEDSDHSIATPPENKPIAADLHEDDVAPPSCGQRWYNGFVRFFWGQSTAAATTPSERDAGAANDPTARTLELTAIAVPMASGASQPRDTADSMDGTQVVPNPLHQAAGGSEEPKDKPLTPEELAALKPFNDYMLQTFNTNTTWGDVAQYAVAALLTGALGMELWGEYQMTIDRVFTSLEATSPELVKAILYDPGTRWIKPLFAQYFLINVILALVPYLPFRLYQFVQTVTPGIENAFKRTVSFLRPHCPKGVQACLPTHGSEAFQSFAKPIPWWTQGLGLLVLVGAATVGMGPAYSSYETNKPYQSHEGATTIFYTNTIPAFIFIFYTLDAMLRLQNLKTKAFNRAFVGRGDSAAKERAELNEDLRNAKQAILEQQSTALSALLGKMTALNQQGASPDVTAAEGIDQFKILRGLGKARGLGKTRTASESPKRRSVRSYLRQYGPHALAAILSMPIAYLTGRSTYEGIGGALEYVATGKPGTSLYDQVIINEAIVDAEYQAEQIPLWDSAITSDTVIYNGLGSGGGDWCSQCLGPPEWGNYILAWAYPPNPKATLVNFNHCPGVITTGDLSCAPATDLLYTNDTCQNMFYGNEAWVQTPNIYMADIDAIDPHLDSTQNITSYTPPPGADVGAGIGAGFAALAQYGMSVLAAKNFFERWINSYRKHPTEILPGKRNAYLTTAQMSWALLQSFVRSAPVLVSGLRIMKNDQIDPALMWMILAAATSTSMATYFPEFDTVYSRIPKWIANDVPGGMLRLYNVGKGKLRKALGWQETRDVTFNLFRKPVGELTFPQRDKLFIDIDKLLLRLAGADPEIIRMLHSSGWQLPPSEMRRGMR